MIFQYDARAAHGQAHRYLLGPADGTLDDHHVARGARVDVDRGDVALDRAPVVADNVVERREVEEHRHADDGVLLTCEKM